MDLVNQTRRTNQTIYSNSDHIASRREDNVYYTSSAPPPGYVITTKGHTKYNSI